MRHLSVLIYIVSLLFGMVCLSALGSRHSRERNARSLSALLFFGAYSILVVVMAAFAYVFVNMPASPRLTLAFAAAVIAAMAPVQITQADFVFADRGIAAPGLKRTLIVLGGGVTALSAICVFFIAPKLTSNSGILLALPAFASFAFTVAFSMIMGFRSRSRNASVPFRYKRAGIAFAAAYAGLIAFAAYELWLVNAIPSSIQWQTVSLPLLYMLTAAQFSLDSTGFWSPAREAQPVPRPPAAEIPPDIAEAFALTPRETEMGRLILSGYGNKEIASALGISENTVRNHIYSLYQKLGIQKRMDLVAIASNFAGRGATGTKIPDKPD